MKKLLAILMGAAIVTAYVPCFAATLLSDRQMGQIYAGSSIEINVVDSTRSAVGAQSNLAVVGSGSHQERISILNNNDLSPSFLSPGYVHNIGNSAAALQSNLAVLVSKGGNINAVDIENKNTAEVDNGYQNGGEGGITASSLTANFSSPEINLAINSVAAKQSAVAAQSNIAALIAVTGGVSNTSISNSNLASVDNHPFDL